MVETRLEHMYQKVMELEKFAEAKNSVLVTFIGVILLLLQQVFGRDFYSFPNVFYGTTIFVALLAALISFLPYYNSKDNPDKKKVKFTKEMDLFDIKILATIQYKDNGIIAFLSSDTESSSCYYQEALLKSVLYNARITNRKLELFRFSIRTLFLIPPIIWLVCWCCRKIRSKISGRKRTKLNKKLKK